jgi:hypothetical protein
MWIKFAYYSPIADILNVVTNAQTNVIYVRNVDKQWPSDFMYMNRIKQYLFVVENKKSFFLFVIIKQDIRSQYISAVYNNDCEL